MAPFIDGGRTIDRTNWSNTVISYYPFGGAIALALDLTLRDRCDGRALARRLHAGDVARVRQAGRQPRRLRRSSVHDRRRRGDAGRGQRRRARSRATSSRATFRATTSPTTRGCSRAPGSPCGSATRDARGSAICGSRRAAARASPALVAPTWPIYAAGLDQDDELQQIDGQRISGDGDRRAVLRRHKPGDTSPGRVRRSHRHRRRRRRSTLAEDPHLEVVPVEARRHADGGAESVSRALAGSEVMPCSLAADPRRGRRRHQLRAQPEDPDRCSRERRTSRSSSRPAAARAGGLEARLAGVVVAALKEAFDRDTRRLELEREQLEAERERAERALRLELQRQAGDREIGRLRLLAGVAVASWLGTLFFSARLLGGRSRRRARRARRRVAAAARARSRRRSSRRRRSRRSSRGPAGQNAPSIRRRRRRCALADRAAGWRWSVWRCSSA